MQTQSRPTTVLLAIIAALLAANLIVNLPPQEATAQTHRATAGDDDGGDVVLVGISFGMGHIFRLWSDGVVEERVAITIGNGFDPLYWHPSRPKWVAIENLP